MDMTSPSWSLAASLWQMRQGRYWESRDSSTAAPPGDFWKLSVYCALFTVVTSENRTEANTGTNFRQPGNTVDSCLGQQTAECSKMPRLYEDAGLLPLLLLLRREH